MRSFAEPADGNRSPLDPPTARQKGRSRPIQGERVTEIWLGRDAAAPEKMGPVLLEPRQPREWGILVSAPCRPAGYELMATSRSALQGVPLWSDLVSCDLACGRC